MLTMSQGKSNVRQFCHAPNEHMESLESGIGIISILKSWFGRIEAREGL